MYIITRNSTCGGRTPLKSESYHKAKELLLKITVENIRQQYKWHLLHDVGENASDDEVIEWAKAKFVDLYDERFVLEDDYSYIYDGGDEVEEVYIYNLDELKEE